MPEIPQTAEVDLSDVRTFNLIPAGWYAAEMTASTQESAKSGNGDYLKLEFELLEAPHAGRKVWVNLNLWNANEEAVRIANQQRLELLTALDRPDARNTEELHGLPCMLKVGIREDRTGRYEPQNVVKGFKPYGNAAPAAPGARAAPPSAARPAAAAPAAKKPWER